MGTAPIGINTFRSGSPGSGIVAHFLAGLDRQRAYLNYESSHKMATALQDLAREQCRDIPEGVSYPGSSEVIESLIGKYKQSQDQHSRGGFTKMLLVIGASVVEMTENVVVESLTAIREIDVRNWTKTALGTTLPSMRRLAFPGTKGA